MVLIDIIMTNLKEYVFGSWFLLGLFIVVAIIIIAIYSNIGKSAIFLLLAPIVLVLAKIGILPNYVIALVLIGVLLLWGIMFKLFLGKNS